MWNEAHADYPLPIGDGQTISQPYIVALMTQSLKLRKEDKVLEVGTGSGYQAAVLAEIVQQVYSVEIVKTLAEKAQRLLPSLGYRNINIKTGEGYRGWEEYAPFDAIIITCAVNHVPAPLVNQLRDGGRIVLPLGDSGLFSQRLVLGTKKGGKFDLQHITGVRFVPMGLDPTDSGGFPPIGMGLHGLQQIFGFLLRSDGHQFPFIGQIQGVQSQDFRAGKKLEEVGFRKVFQFG